MSWIVRYEEKVNSCQGCDLFGKLAGFFEFHGCKYDDKAAIEDDNGVDIAKYPSEIRPCQLKVEAPTPHQEYSFETGV